jgi:hypothetical protein
MPRPFEIKTERSALALLGQKRDILGVQRYMWLFTADGFFSTVIDKMEPGRMLIRARCERDIQSLYGRFKAKCPSMRKPTSDETRDYRWRLSIGKRDWVKLAAELASEVDYPNFKSAVHRKPDQRNKSRAYAEVWATMHRVQVEDSRRENQVGI